MVGRLSADNLMKRLQQYGAKVLGSRPYWYQHYSERNALIEQKGAPTFFWTVSSADNYWPELHNLMHSHQHEPSHHERIQAVIKNPHITDWYFTSKLSDWIEHWHYQALGAEWHWGWCEYAGRGSTHAHGGAKLANDPGICTLIKKAAVAWAIQEFADDSEPVNATLIQEGKDAKAIVLQYVDWLVTMCNRNVPYESWSSPIPQPCSLLLDSITDVNEDYANLISCVE